MKVFIAGVMQGNRRDNKIYPQDYRKVIKSKLLGLYHGEIEIIDPDETDPSRLTYNLNQAKDMFIKYTEIAGKVDLLISFLPEASMGSAIEMWSAYNSKTPIITISPLKSNWVIKLLSTVVYSSLEEFNQKLNKEELYKLIS